MNPTNDLKPQALEAERESATIHSLPSRLGRLEKFLEGEHMPRAAETVRHASEALSDSTDRLVMPDGWFLFKAQHQHTYTHFSGEKAKELPHAGGAWFVEFHALVNNSNPAHGRGRTLYEAWGMAVRAVAAREARNG